MSDLAYLIPAGLVLAGIAALLTWDLVRNIRKTHPRGETDERRCRERPN